jgi:Fe2+ transport system protein FeoA
MNQIDPAQLKPGHIFIIADFSGEEVILERMRELGLRSGVQLKFIRRAPFGGPFLFQVATTLLALRKEELDCLKFKELPND